MAMKQPREQRRLLALLVSDIAGYSRLMALDEADTFHRVQDLQSTVIIPATKRNDGQVIKWTGDGFIATFNSAVDALRAAIEIQSGSKLAAACTPDERRIQLRIGI